MKKEFKQTKELVKYLLEKYPKTRNSDQLLYVKVVEKLNPGAKGEAFEAVMLNLESMGLPCFETVRRSRQEIQAKNPRLKAVPKVQDYRTKREEEFRKEFRR